MSVNPYLASPAAGAARPTMVRYRVLAWLCAAAIIAYVHRNAIAVAEQDIRGDLGLTIVEMGWVMTAFYIGYAALQVPCGWLGDRCGARGPLAVFGAVWSIAAGLMAVAGGYFGLVFLRLACGAGQAGLFPCAAKAIMHWLPAARRALACGALASCMSVGAACAHSLTGELLGRGMDWRGVLAIYLVPGLLWSVGFYVAFRDSPREHAGVNEQEQAIIRGVQAEGPNAPQSAARLPTPWGAILSAPAMWLLCGQQFFRAAGYLFYTSWFPTYLRETGDVTTVAAGWLASLPLWAVVVGAPLGGLLSDRLLERTGSRRLSRQAVGAGSMLACAALVLPAFWTDNPVAAALVVSAGSFCAAFAGPVSYTTTMDLGGRHVATVFGIMNMCGNIGAAVFPVLAAGLRAATGGWDLVLVAFASSNAAAAVCWLLLDPGSTVADQAA